MPAYGYREHTELPKPLRFLRNRKLTVLLLGMFAVVLLVTFSNKGLLRRIMMERELQHKHERVEELRADIAELRKNRDLLRDDKATIERVARESHGMIRRGEVVFRVRPVRPHTK